MQAGPDPGTPGPSHPGVFDMGEDTPMHDPSSASAGNPSSTGRAPESTILTRLQQRKRAAIVQPEDPASAEEPEVSPAAPKGKSIPQKKESQKKVTIETEQGAAQQDNSPSLGQAKNAHPPQKQNNVGKANWGIESAITQAQEKTRIEAKKNDEMWGRIAKAVDVAMAAETPGRIDRDQVKHIINAILECASPKPQWKSLTQPDSQDQESATQSALPTDRPNKPATWANIAAQGPPQTTKPMTKPSLAQPLRGVRTDSRLMIRLGENSPHRNEHPFILQKKANLALPPNVIIGKVAHINSGLALIPSPGTKLEQLEENADRLAQSFGACRAERNEKWAKYLVREVPKRIMTLDGLTNVTTEMAEQAFEMSCGMKPEWGRWSTRPGEMAEEVIEANMIFAVRQQKILTIPKVIPLLGRMRVIVALPPKETPRQCSQCGEWTHKKENCAKRPRCFHCSSDKHDASYHSCTEEECKDSLKACPHPPKCIVCSGPHTANFEHCPLKPAYSKPKGSMRRLGGADVSQIRGQQKLIRDRVVRENRIQNEMAAQVANPGASTLADNMSVAENLSNK